VFKEVVLEVVPEDATILLTSTWAMKKKANGTFHARLNARGFEQVDGEHYGSDDKSAPVLSEISIRVILTLIVMAAWWAELMDVLGVFLHGGFDPKHMMYMFVPQGFEAWYPSNVVLLLLHIIYGTKQVANRFWKKLLAALRCMGFAEVKRMLAHSAADSSLLGSDQDRLTVELTWSRDAGNAVMKRYVFAGAMSLLQLRRSQTRDR
jgi:uncharacterized membrane protein YheB (UPF0754 family)